MRVFGFYNAAEAMALEAIVAAANWSEPERHHASASLPALLSAAGSPFTSAPLRAPSPSALARLPPSSPLLLTLLGDDAHTYYGDGLPTGLRLGLMNTSVCEDLPPVEC